MPEKLNPLDPVLADLTWAASQARLIPGAGEGLADDISALVNRYRTGAPARVAAAPEVVADPAAQPVADPEESADVEGDFGDFVAGQLGDVEDDLRQAATPHDITLSVRRTDGFVLQTDDAIGAVRVVLDSIISMVGPLDVHDAVVDPEDSSKVDVILTGGPATRLEMFGAGRDGFNAAFPLVGVGEVVITSRVGDVADVDLAAELGLLPPELPEQPEGKHAINGTLDLVEEMFGERPEPVTDLFVRYTKNNGAAMTSAEVATIVNGPISTGPQGLSRFGRFRLDEVMPGRADNELVARIALSEVGEVDAATLRLQATAYTGTLPFAGIGSVTACAFVSHDDALDIVDDYNAERDEG